jgi:ATP-dependent Zn protease
MTDKASKLYRLTPRRRLRRTACRKAGHAVVGRALGQVCGHAMIEHDLGESEAVHGITADPWTTMSAWDAIGRPRDYDTIMHGRIMTYMAGAEAEEVLLGDCAGGDGEDRRQVALMLSTLLGDADEMETEAWEQRLRRHTRGLVRRHAGKIELVVEALLLRRRLEGSEIDGLLTVSGLEAGLMSDKGPARVAQQREMLTSLRRLQQDVSAIVERVLQDGGHSATNGRDSSATSC